jgi:hypothetical protein
MERRCKHVFSTIEAVFYAWSVLRVYKTDNEDRLNYLGFETPACQDMSLGTEE